MAVRRDSWRYRARIGLLSWLGAVVLRLLGATWRVRRTGVDPYTQGTPFLAATWHQSILIAGHVFRDTGLAIPVSRSRDGDQVVALLDRLGFAESLRGSSSRGATSLLREMIRRLGDGDVVAILPDGPRGPARRAKPGVIAAAAATGVRIVPVGFAARPVHRLGSWDRTAMPLPFARVRIHYGEAFHVPKSLGEPELEKLRAELDLILEALHQGLERELDGGRAGTERLGDDSSAS